ncbi:MAG: glycosyltransferase family 39 protein [Bryobacteraceae bacterium]|nr:glycosyltransferase family 39 protein [Bryobacteraceae bacterium]
MRRSHTWQELLFSDLGVLLLLALGLVIVHTLTNGQYGFHRDELATLDDAHYPAWGYPAYPSVTPFIARIALELFGPSMAGVRFFAALAQGVVLVLSGLMARELGGGRWAQIVAAVAVAIAPVALGSGALFQYVTFDYLWWVALAYLLIRLLKSGNPRWWLAVGIVAGLGLMTRYTMAFLLAALLGGMLFTPARRYLRSPWFWGGAALAVSIFLPNLIWQFQHDFISLELLRSNHARDIRIGRTDSYLTGQLMTAANLFTVPLWLAGLWYYLRRKEGEPYKLIGWLYVLTLLLYLFSHGRDYYEAPAYPMLLASGAVAAELWIAKLSNAWARAAKGVLWTALVAGGLLIAAVVLPVAPVNSRWWNFASGINGDIKEEIGWPELVQTVANIRDSLPASDRAQLGILAGNYGEAGALNLYGAAYGLPRAMSGIDSYWLRGYTVPPPQTLIVVGISREFLEKKFESCELAGHITNRFNVKNEETTRHVEIYLCRRLKQPWPEFWEHFKYFG